MKDTPTALKNKYAEEVCTLAGMWRILRKDGTELGFTDHVETIPYNGLDYEAASGFSRTALESDLGLAVDNMEAHGLLDSNQISERDLRAGLYRDAEVWYFELDYTNTSLGIQKLDYGIIGRITIKEDSFEAEIRSLTSLLNQEQGDKYGRYCRNTLGDSNCSIVLDPVAWTTVASSAVAENLAVKASVYDGRRYVCTTAGTTGATEPIWDTAIGNTTPDGTAVWTCYAAYTYEGSVTSVTSKKVFTDTTRTETDNVFQYGTVTFTSGLNNGISMDVKTNLSGVITLLFPMPFDITIGDDYSIVYGCNRLLKAPGDDWETTYTGHCRAKFSPETNGNAKNFNGECEIPGTDSAFTIVT